MPSSCCDTHLPSNFLTLTIFIWEPFTLIPHFSSSWQTPLSPVSVNPIVLGVLDRRITPASMAHLCCSRSQNFLPFSGWVVVHHRQCSAYSRICQWPSGLHLSLTTGHNTVLYIHVQTLVRFCFPFCWVHTQRWGHWTISGFFNFGVMKLLL